MLSYTPKLREVHLLFKSEDNQSLATDTGPRLRAPGARAHNQRDLSRGPAQALGRVPQAALATAA